MNIKKITFALLLLCPLWLQAQFLSVDWATLRGDSVLPVCASVVDLPADYANYAYSAHIEYPEYQKMTSEEVERYSLNVKYENMSAQPQIECTVFKFYCSVCHAFRCVDFKETSCIKCEYQTRIKFSKVWL